MRTKQINGLFLNIVFPTLGASREYAFKVLREFDHARIIVLKGALKSHKVYFMTVSLLDMIGNRHGDIELLVTFVYCFVGAVQADGASLTHN